MKDPWGTAALTTGIMGCLTVIGWFFLIPILTKLFSVLTFDAPRKLRELEIRTIPDLKQTLRDVEEQRMMRGAKGKGSESDSKRLYKLIVDLKSALYDAEDILDLIDYHQIETRVNSGAKEGRSSSQTDGNAVHSLFPIFGSSSLIKRIEHIESIVDDSKKSDLLNQQSSCSSNIPIQESSRRHQEIHVLHEHIGIKEKVFGRKELRNDICRMLRNGADSNGPSSRSSRYSVIGIHGIAGSGKTTLAKYVCDYEKAKGNHFNLVLFIPLCEAFKLHDIFRDMLEQMTQDRPSDTKGIRILQKELKKNLQGKRFLLVLDNIWVKDSNLRELNILLDLLDAGQSGSRILVTAQTKHAATALGAQEQIAIPDMEAEQYLSLFMHHALDGAVDEVGYFKRIGSKIAKKLHRSPLVAVTVARRLQRNRNISFWKSAANLDVLNETMGALWWSYQQLHPDARRCFEYCSTFPRGYKLARDKLVRMWIAQGFVNSRSTGTHDELEDVGQLYFDELLAFSFLQVLTDSFGAMAFIIHGLLHEFVERVAGSEFFRIDLSDLSDSSKVVPPEVRHLFIETNNGDEFTEKNLDLGNLQTLIIKDKYKDKKERLKTNRDFGNFFEHLFMRLRKVRVLIIDMVLTEVSLPASIDQMKNLRYIGLHYLVGHLDLILPSTFSKLYYMQTIDVPSYCHISCPEDMANLIHLRHISGCLFFPNIGRLTSLQTLAWFEVKERQGYELKQLKHLNKLRGTLHIGGLGIVGSKEEALEAHLTCKNRVTALSLSFSGWQTFYGWQTRDPELVDEVLEGLCPPKDLVELTIIHYNGCRYPSWMLSRHHPDAPKQLQKLHLSNCAQMASFPRDSELLIHLRELQITFCHWDRFPENMECLLSLRRLLIWRCDKIELLPKLPQSLEEIRIEYCIVLSPTCREERHENWRRIQHIPQKWIL